MKDELPALVVEGNAGMRGFDCNTPLTTESARAMQEAGYRFAIRYVPRVVRRSYDLTAEEVRTILAAGLGLMVVQHVAREGWSPTGELGEQYGVTAAREAHMVGYPKGAVLWCDLEGVAARTHPADVVAFCNAWWRDVKRAGYEPGLYVGYHAGLSADALYHYLAFSRYWSAYNLNGDQYPAVRGVQMRQGAFPGAVPGAPFEFDVDTIQPYAMGDVPRMAQPLELAVSRDLHGPDVPPVRTTPVVLPPRARPEPQDETMDKNEVLEWLKKELTEERTDAAIQFVGDELKRGLPDLPVEIAEKVADWFFPDKIFAVLERAIG